MPRTPAPSMPTSHQIEEAHRAVAAIFPSVRIRAVGPEGVTFDYPDEINADSAWQGKPFSADGQ